MRGWSSFSLLPFSEQRLADILKEERESAKVLELVFPLDGGVFWLCVCSSCRQGARRRVWFCFLWAGCEFGATHLPKNQSCARELCTQGGEAEIRRRLGNPGARSDLAPPRSPLPSPPGGPTSSPPSRASPRAEEGGGRRGGT